jgi:bifunctional N-acetylglucosamine-1-phosphate-uridyltransferase/glucosamine-1-phosphate-acetyltransferase GlmU-like protein
MRPDVPLVLLAAGLGSRFGGVKPLAPVGPNGEPLLYLALQQAARTGFQRAIVVVGDTTSAAIREALTGRWQPDIGLTIVSQEAVGPARNRPWGTVAAVLAAGLASDVVVANGDDLYGEAGLTAARDWMQERPASDAAGIFYSAGTTVADRGVSRGVPTVVRGRMRGIVEQRDVRRSGGVVTLSDGTMLAEDQPVSMNLWCLRRSALRELASGFERFVDASASDETAEYGLSTALGQLAGTLRIDARLTRSTWHGVTYAADVADVRAALSRGPE